MENNLKRNRGGVNLNYDIGFKNEDESFIKYKDAIMFMLDANQLEQSARGLMDKATGTDAVAQIQGNVYGISLRVREKDYNSFTLSRNINDVNSEVNKWIKERKKRIKPSYHIQISKLANNKIRVIRINIDVFGKWLKVQIKDSQLEKYYNKKLLAYEFPLDEIKEIDGIYTEIYNHE